MGISFRFKYFLPRTWGRKYLNLCVIPITFETGMTNFGGRGILKNIPKEFFIDLSYILKKKMTFFVPFMPQKNHCLRMKLEIPCGIFNCKVPPPKEIMDIVLFNDHEIKYISSFIVTSHHLQSFLLCVDSKQYPFSCCSVGNTRS